MTFKFKKLKGSIPCAIRKRANTNYENFHRLNSPLRRNGDSKLTSNKPHVN